jgi:hypothetical protein
VPGRRFERALIEYNSRSKPANSAVCLVEHFNLSRSMVILFGNSVVSVVLSLQETCMHEHDKRKKDKTVPELN